MCSGKFEGYMLLLLFVSCSIYRRVASMLPVSSATLALMRATRDSIAADMISHGR